MIGVGAPIWKITSAVSNISVPLTRALIVTVSSVLFTAVTVYVPSPLSVTALNIASPVVDNTIVAPPVVIGFPSVSNN